MTFLWLVVWLLWHTPPVAMFQSWNNWGIALAVCVVIDFTTALGAGSRGARRRPA